VIDYHEFLCSEIVTLVFRLVVTGGRVQMYHRPFLYGVKTLTKANIHSGGYETIRFITINKCLCSYRELYEYFSHHFIPAIECQSGGALWRSG
jgi:hypothetical protein